MCRSNSEREENGAVIAQKISEIVVEKRNRVLGAGAASPRLIPTGERSGLLTHIAATESVSIAAAHKGAAVVPHHCTRH